jgi:hypothetical protein
MSTKNLCLILAVLCFIIGPVSFFSWKKHVRQQEANVEKMRIEKEAIIEHEEAKTERTKESCEPITVSQ